MSVTSVGASLLRVLLALALVLAVVAAAFMGWHVPACGRDWADGASWGLLAMIFLPLALPELGALLVFAVLAGTAGVAALMKPPRSVLSVALWMIALAAGAFGAGFGLARLTHATARCSFGF